MRIMVFDVPAEHGGALSVLTEFYNEVKEYEDKNINWIFVLSTPHFKEANNIKIIRFPWIKKSWWHRLYFDYIVAPKLVKKYKVNKIISLQNVIIPKTKVSQTVYVHQSLPFVEYRFSFTENKIFWLYQNVISKIILKSIRKADKVIVQTNWFKKAIMKKSSVNEEKIIIVPPKINVHIKDYFQENKQTRSTFFYPSSALTYKNHQIIVEACKILKEKNIKNYQVIFTLEGNENALAVKLYEETLEKQLPIKFIGSISRERVFEYYTKSVLIFPSYIETFGLPMLEAKMHNSHVLASDCSFSHEILDEYENAIFFNPFNAEELAELMHNSIANKRKNNTVVTLNNFKYYKGDLIEAALFPQKY
ncbi:glycosyltransferase [Evansella sp. LMS18]|uniref:glycosyltransferase n=1 Tax=Evansella sp. LMS18 TaxID=2924033 RepID=UPI0020D00D8F|nr:glycosyltransferase [Evansella sp. LMS18]UTR12123.1 glycosyltransferase [Evansella sp. LMS18]